MFGDRLRETTTTSGAITAGSSIVLGGAVAQYGQISSRVLAGDPCTVDITDAGGSVWLSFEGTLVDATHVTVDVLVDGSSGLRTGVTLTSGTHKIIVTLLADDYSKRLYYADYFLDSVVSALATPTTSASLVGSTSAGVAYVVGRRIRKGAQAFTYTASKDTYVDIDYDSNLVKTAVTNGATAPAIAANALRLGKVVTNGTTITGGTDLRNLIRVPTCVMSDSTAQTVVSGTTKTLAFASPAAGFIDNDGMHSTTVNNSRFTIQRQGLYQVSGSLRYDSLTVASSLYGTVFKNGVATPFEDSAYSTSTIGHYQFLNPTGVMNLSPNDYLELMADQFTGGNLTVGLVSMAVVRIG